MSDQPARSGAEILAQIQGVPPRQGVAHICMNPGLIDQWEAANDALTEAQAEDSGKPRLGTGGTSAKTKAAAEKVRDIETQIADADVAFTFQKVSKTRYSEICDENPPRKDNLQDFGVGYNREAVDVVVAHEALKDPVFEWCERNKCAHADCGSWQALLNVLGPGEWNEILGVVRDLHGAVTGAPKSVLASRILDRAGQGSRRRAPSA